MIDSIRVKFPLSDDEHSDDVIERLISKGIAKGAKRIELLFAYDTCFVSNLKPYTFSFDMLLGTDSLTYLHLQNCCLVKPLDFSGLKNVRTLVLQLVRVKQNRLEGLFSNCIHLVDFTLDGYIIASNLSSIEYSCNDDSVRSMNIEAHVLSKFSFRGRKIYKPVGFVGLKNVTTIVLDGHCEFLHPTNIVSLLFSECLELQDRIDINALNLASFEYNGYMRRKISVTAPRLLKIFWNAARREKNPHPFGPTITLQHIQNLAMILSTSQVAKVTEFLVKYRNLRQLELFIDGAYDPNMDYFWILDIAMASQHLQKLSVTIRNLHLENSHMVGFKRQRKEYAEISHNDLKYVELRGCVCSTNVIEMASCLLRNASSLKQITFSSLDKFYIGAGRWTNGSDGCCWFERNLIHENLKDEVHEQCQLIIF
ncbi:hypothetical protein QL285_039896 [Trifolium repens]|nr:hypothetical protein QL285_039896 [Trifolium repens]